MLQPQPDPMLMQATGAPMAFPPLQQPDPMMMQTPQAPIAMPALSPIERSSMAMLPPMSMPPMSMPPMAMPPAAMQPMSFLQESFQDTSNLIRSAAPIEGCSCGCAKKENALITAQHNAMRLMEFPEEGEPVPWGHAGF